MTSVILERAARLLLPLMLLFSLFLLLRGHNEPGGGFSGGLVASAALALLVLAHGVARVRWFLRVEPGIVAAVGLGVAVVSGLPGLITSGEFMRGLWLALPAGEAEVWLGTPLLFDVGVYLTVVGVVTSIVFALGEEQPWSR